MKTIDIVVALTFLSLPAICSSEVGSVRLHVVNSLGEEQHEFTIDSFLDRKGNDLRQRFRDSVAHEIPYGTYEIKISSRRGGASKRVGVYKPSSLCVLDTGGIDYPDKIGPDIVSGRVIPPPKGPGKAWVKSMQLYGYHEGTWDIGEDGAFSMHNLDPGRYVLLVMKGTKVLKVFFYEMKSSHPPFTIPLN